jgi:hypothetical protein
LRLDHPGGAQLPRLALPVFLGAPQPFGCLGHQSAVAAHRVTEKQNGGQEGSIPHELIERRYRRSQNPKGRE